MKMTKKEALEILEKRRVCMESGGGAMCDRQCGSCEFGCTEGELVSAYEKAIEALREVTGVTEVTQEGEDGKEFPWEEDE